MVAMATSTCISSWLLSIVIIIFRSSVDPPVRPFDDYCTVLGGGGGALDLLHALIDRLSPATAQPDRRQLSTSRECHGY